MAVKTAELSTCRMKHGAVIVRGGSVLSLGINKFKNNPQFILDYDECSTHAEIDAIRRAGDCKGATIYVARVNKQSQTRLSRPCNRCYTAIKTAGIKKIVFTD